MGGRKTSIGGERCRSVTAPRSTLRKAAPDKTTRQPPEWGIAAQSFRSP